MHRCLKVLAVFTIGLLALPGIVQPLRAGEPNSVTAIDILLEPDATMIEQAKAANQRLLKTFPIGFALDETHHPHITCLQRYVETADLNKLYEAVGKVLAEERPTSWKLKAYKPVMGEGSAPSRHTDSTHCPCPCVNFSSHAPEV